MGQTKMVIIHDLYKKMVSSIGTAVILVSCASQTQEPQSIKIDGSSTVYPIMQKAVEDFKATDKESADITVQISGTGGGFRSFCAGETDISNASRPIQVSEMDSCSQAGVSYVELPIAFDALTVAVNPQNDWISSITTEELRKIWEPSAEKKITRWNQVREGFPDKPLNLFGADKDSGTFEYFTEALMGEAGASRQDYVNSEDDNTLVDGVAQDPNALGYFGLSYYETNTNRLKALAIDSGKGEVLPSRENVADAMYQPLARPLFIYVNLKSAQDNPKLRDFIDFFLKNAEKTVQSVDYIPLTEESYHIGSVTFNKGEAGTVFEGKSQFDVTIPELQRKQAQLRVESK